jgi:hypothetical protein
MKLFLFLFVSAFSVHVFGQIKIEKSQMLYPENIIKLTFDNSDRIKSAFYNLEAAKYNFKLFESEYTQFNPLIINSDLHTNSDRENSGELSAGMSKEFFDGTSITSSMGNNSGWGRIPENRNVSFIESEVSFPLFSSARKLDRLIKRTFEENELYTKNLEYVDEVRHNILFALEQYYDLVPRYKSYNMYKTYRNELNSILTSDSLKNKGADREQIKAEINSLNSKITGFEISLFNMQSSMQRIMNIERIDLSQLTVIDIDFKKPDYFGNYYIIEPTDSIFSKALKNDTEFKVLNIIKKNAEEKKKLAEKGKWDIFATTGGRYNFYDVLGGARQDNFLTADAGLKVKLYDNKVLKNTIAKAQADISAIEYTISDRKKEISSEINQLKEALTKKKDQLVSTLESLNSWKKNYEDKKALFLSDNESVDNYIQAFRSLLTSEETWYNLENNYLDTIRDFDFICGTYFEYIDLKN